MGGKFKHMKYREILNEEIDCYEYNCFFAFSDKQVLEGMKKASISEGEKLYSDGGGLHGTKEGLRRYFTAIKEKEARIAKECNPQEVYDYEFANHECGYVCDDEEAIRIAVHYFGKEVAKKIERRFGYIEIDNL
jgi:hypothetical protein